VLRVVVRPSSSPYKYQHCHRCVFFFSIFAATEAPPLAVASVEPPLAMQTTPPQPPRSRAPPRPLVPTSTARDARVAIVFSAHGWSTATTALTMARPLRSISVFTERTIVIAVSS
jgi:hypothetical protein